MKHTVKLTVLAITPVIGALVIWGALILALGAEHPVLVVEGHSMEPTLMPGDLIFVQAVRIEDVKAGPDGDIVAFYQPGSGKTKIIVHRAIRKIVNKNGVVGLVTKGDNVPFSDIWHIVDDGFVREVRYITGEELIGKVVFRIPFLGAVVKFVRSPEGLCIVAFIYGLFLVQVSLAGSEKQEKGAVEKS